MGLSLKELTKFRKELVRTGIEPGENRNTYDGNGLKRNSTTQNYYRKVMNLKMYDCTSESFENFNYLWN